MKTKLCRLMAGLMLMALALSSGCNKSASNSSASGDDLDDSSGGSMEARVDHHGDEVMASTSKGGALLVVLPKEKDARAKVFEVGARADTAYQNDPTTDKGQKYLYYSLD